MKRRLIADINAKTTSEPAFAILIAADMLIAEKLWSHYRPGEVNREGN
jgi:hypothetical protein